MREMLRIKRSVQAKYNTNVNMMAAQMQNSATNQIIEPLDAMRLLDSKISGKLKFSISKQFRNNIFYSSLIFQCIYNVNCK